MAKSTSKKSFPKLKKKTPGAKSGVELRIANLAKFADEAMKVIIADKGKSAPKAVVDKVKVKMDPPSKARVAVAIALASKELGKSTHEVATAFMSVKLFKGTLKKFERKLSEHIDSDVVAEISSMLTAVYKFMESSYALGRRKKGDREMADEVDDKPVKKTSKRVVEEEEEEEEEISVKKGKATRPVVAKIEEEEEEEEDDNNGLEPDDDQPKPKAIKSVSKPKNKK